MSSPFFLEESYSKLRGAIASQDPYNSSYPTLPAKETLSNAREALPDWASPNFFKPAGPEATMSHIRESILPALTGQALSSRYYGFVTGGVLPVAEAADNVVSAMDQNVQVHLPGDSIATEVEVAALRMLAVLLRLETGTEEKWVGRTFTTGATASNVLGLACGREYVLSKRGGGSVGQAGILEACRRANVEEIRVLTSAGHSSLAKAASLVGLGRESVKELPLSKDGPWRLDFDALGIELARPGVACIIAVSAGEVNTGNVAVEGIQGMARLRQLADEYGAWIHVDGAFGVFARALPDTPEFARLRQRVDGMELADSITADGHKLLNVPYDCGIFFSRHGHLLDKTFVNQNAAYLSAEPGSTPSPLNIGIENSRRFRALPVYAALYSEGQEGIAAMFARMVQLARKIAEFIRDSEPYILLPGPEPNLEDTHIIVLFQAKHEGLNSALVRKINDSRQMYVSGTTWKGNKATRIAVSSWKVDVERDFEVVKDILRSIAKNTADPERS